MALAEELHWFAATDVGRRRSHNEDSFLADEELGLFIVADGMGGHAAGEIASEIAVRTIHEVVAAQREALSTGVGRSPRSDLSHRQILGVLEYAIQAASARIHGEAKRDKRKRGMGTTISLLLVTGAYGYVAHVGDSRIYLLRNGNVQQVTEDHTVANELLRLGMVTPDELINVPRRNAITRAVGVYEHAEVDTLRVDILPNDQFLLSSDGLTSYFVDPAEDIVNLLAEKDGERTVRALIDFANERGGKDNITVMLVRFGSGDTADTARARRVQLKREVLAQLPLFARLNDRELLRMMQVAEVHLYDKGDVVVAEGERGDHMFVMLQGRLQVTRGGKVIGELKSGEQLGEMALIRSTPRSATVTALEDSELISLNRRDFFDIIRIEPHLAVKLLWQFLGVLADRLEEANRHLTEDHVLPSTEEILPSQPPLDSEDRPTPVPDDPFAQPSFSIGRIPLSVAQAMPEGALVLDTSGAHRIEDSPSFDDAPELAQRRVPMWQEGVTLDDSPSWDSWDHVGENDPETRRRHETPPAPAPAPAQHAPQAGLREPKKTRPEIERHRTKTRPWKVPSPEGFSKGDAPKPSRPRHKTLQSAGSVPPEAPTSDVPPSGEPDEAPAGRRMLKGTMPDGRLRAAREEALIHASTMPLPGGNEGSEEPEFRPTKQTIPMQPDESLKQELEALRAEFKQRLEKSRRERGQKDSD